MTLSLPLPAPAAAFARLHDYAGAWAMQPAAASLLYATARGCDWSAHLAEPREPRTEAETSRLPARSAGGRAGGLSPGRGQTVAVVSLSGVLMRHAASMTDSTSTVAARNTIRSLARDDSVAGILLDINSPGGTCSGTDDLAREVASAAERKPVHAFVDDLCASAAYWVASQCSRIHASGSTAMIGSIGTYQGLYDLSAAAEKEGVEAVLIATHELKGAGFPGAPVTDAQRADFRRLVDQLQGHFSDAVVTGRGLAASLLDPKAEGTLATGQVWLAADAIAHGLCDDVASFEEAVDAVAAAAETFKAGGQTADAGRTAGSPALQLLPLPNASAMNKPAPAGPSASDAPAPDPEPQAEPTPAAEPAVEPEQVPEEDQRPSENPGDGEREPRDPYEDQTDKLSSGADAPAAEYRREFGTVQGSVYFADGKSLAEARAAEVKRLQAENDELRKSQSSATPAPAGSAAPPHSRTKASEGRKASAFDYATGAATR